MLLSRSLAPRVSERERAEESERWDLHPRSPHRHMLRCAGVRKVYPSVAMAKKGSAVRLREVPARLHFLFEFSPASQMPHTCTLRFNIT